MDTEWMGQGKCKDMDPAFFFPSDGVGVRLAQNVCADCPVKAPCLEYALALHCDSFHDGLAFQTQLFTNGIHGHHVG